jgi:hypothetical protein
MLRAFCVLLLIPIFSSRSAAADHVLKSDRWFVAVDPSQLVFTGQTPEGKSVPISAATAEAARMTDLTHDGNSLSWKLPDQHLAVNAALEKGVLVVTFRPSAKTTITWPVLSADTGAKAFILPIYEGAFVPADDEPWAAHLINESPMNTTAGLSMPFWGVLHGGNSLTYILTNPFNNELTFARDAGRLTLKASHEFRDAQSAAYEFRIYLGDSSPVTPAKRYREHLMETGQFVSLQQKIAKAPDAAKLLGAPHIYLWGDGLIARNDVRDYKAVATRILDHAGKPVAKYLSQNMSEEGRKLLDEVRSATFVDNFQKGQITGELSRLLKQPDFAGASGGADIASRNCQLLQTEFSDLLNPVETWGDGFSTKMLRALADAKIDRAWLGSPNWDGLGDHPEFTKIAIASGYLVGPYDSYHSMHSPDEADTWETAQFDRALYETGAIVKADGSKRKGFKQKGFLLSPIAARPYLEKRVSSLMDRLKCNSWFMDCDAFGEVFDDYSPAHPATQTEDARERLSRMDWIRDKFGAVVGSEGGSAYAAPVIHFAHGIMTPVLGWGDSDLMKDKQSKFYLGGYFPPDGPAIFFKQVPMKDVYQRIYADPRFRLPLYQTVFHDSVVATHQWGYGSLKFDDPDRTRELLELLYNVPPLYHLNLAEWQKRKDVITSHFAFFSPLHREAGLLPMSDFEWLSEDRLVQRTTFGINLELIANFSGSVFRGTGFEIPPHSIAGRKKDSNALTLYPTVP